MVILFLPLEQEVVNNLFSIRIIPNLIPEVEKKILCTEFLDAVIRFYENPENEKKFRIWCAEKGENAYGQKNS